MNNSMKTGQKTKRRNRAIRMTSRSVFPVVCMGQMNRRTWTDVRLMPSVVFVITFTLFLSSQTFAYTLSGQVINILENAPIEGTLVNLGDLETRTNEEGRYSFEIENGSYSIEVSDNRTNWNNYLSQIQVDGNMTADIEMIPITVNLDFVRHHYLGGGWSTQTTLYRRWRELPIPYYIDTETAPADRREAMIEAVNTTITDWEDSTGLDLFEEVFESTIDNYGVDFRATDGMNRFSDVTYDIVEHESFGRIYYYDTGIVHLSHGGTGFNRGVPPHEVGHALGLEHTNAAGHLMSEGGNVLFISRLEADLIRAVYSMTTPCNFLVYNPQTLVFATPNNGDNYSLDELSRLSNGNVEGRYPNYVVSTLIISILDSLTITRGSKLRFRESFLKDSGIKTFGKLFATGTIDQPVLFTAINPDSGWGEIEATTYDQRYQPELKLSYCSVMFGGRVGGKNISVNNCFFSQNRYLLRIGSSGKAEVTNNFFIGRGGVHVVVGGDSDTIKIRNNIMIFRGNEGDCDGSHAIFIENSAFSPENRENLIQNNLINGFWSGIAISRPHDNHATIKNNIIMHNNVGINASTGRQVVYDCDYNNYYANERDLYDIRRGDHDVYADPLVLNIVESNFRLDDNSPCIDSGDPEIRDPDGSRSDIGAFGGPLGDWTPLSVDQNIDFDPMPDDFEVLQNYPNPFNNYTRIEFVLPSSKIVSLQIFDVVGRQNQNLKIGKMQPGQHSFTFDATNLSSGIYLYRVHYGNDSKIRPMILLR